MTYVTAAGLAYLIAGALEARDDVAEAEVETDDAGGVYVQIRTQGGTLFTIQVAEVS